MAITPSLTIAATTTDGDHFVISDDVGTYDVSTNPSGYGIPNELRTEFALMIVVSYKEYSDGELVDVPLTVSYDPVSVADFTVPTLKDGYYYLTVYWVPIDIYNTSVPTVEELEASSYGQVEQHVPVLSKTYLKRNSINASIIDNIILTNSTVNNTKNRIKNENIRALIEGARREFCKGEYYNFAKITEALNNKICA